MWRRAEKCRLERGRGASEREREREKVRERESEREREKEKDPAGLGTLTRQHPGALALCLARILGPGFRV